MKVQRIKYPSKGLLRKKVYERVYHTKRVYESVYKVNKPFWRVYYSMPIFYSVQGDYNDPLFSII